MNGARFPLYLRILLGMGLGVLVGWIAGERAAPLGDLGMIVIQLIKALAAPLLFFAILDAFMRARVGGRSAGWMLGISAINGSLALGLGLLLSNVLQPGLHLTRERMGEVAAAAHAAPAAAKPAEKPAQGLDVVKSVASYVPSSVAQPFVENAIIPIIVLAVIGGLGLRRAREEQTARAENDWRAVEGVIRTVLRALEIALGYVIATIPFAVFAVVARTVGQYGLAPLKGLAVYVGVVLLGLGLHVGVVYQAWIVLFAPMGLRRFWAGAREAVTYALGASSSLATLPVTLRCLDRMGVSPQSARMAACVGTNFNNDGILLYEAMAAIFVAQACGIHLTFGQQAIVFFTCAAAGVGIAGVPEAGFASLSLVLATAKLPMEILPILLTVDWILSRARAATNVVSDMLVATLLDRFAPPEPENPPTNAPDGAP